ACAMNILEDHVWCEVWFDTWHPYQVNWQRGPTYIDNPGIAGDVDHGGSKDVSCIWDWRNDGCTWDVVGRYSETCTLTVYIEDPDSIPVHNAAVIIASEFYYSPYPIYKGTWGETGRDGTIRFVLGDNQNYYVSVQTGLGSYPESGYASIISASVPGEHYYWSWRTTNAMPQLEMTEGTAGTNAPYVIEVEYDLPYDVQSGRDYYATVYGWYAETLPEGHLEFFIADQMNFAMYYFGAPFVGYMIAEGASANHVQFHVPSVEDYNVVLSGGEHHKLATLANVKVRLWLDDTVGVPEESHARVTGLAQPFPNPVSPQTTLAFDVADAGPVSLTIYDVRGALVRRLVDEALLPGHYERVWDGRDDSGRAVAGGVYFLRMEGSGAAETRKLVVLK
ncbi:MAG: FlgD immunoglobulin-like domain containing protein, partial [Candidatus Eisenbacteria bacterium]